MDTDSAPGAWEVPAEKKWRPLSRVQRRVAGVLVEKAKTTPEQYPLSLNALTAGCNQKSNRAPQMTLSADDVEAALDELRDMGAVVEVQSGGRVAKYKHLMYEWLGVDKTEIAVMAELMLRGEQTVGELRGRAARMETIADLVALRPVLKALADKQLVVELTPGGRGQIVTHGLYEPRELAQLRERYSGGAPPPAAAAPSPASPPPAAPPPAAPATPDELQALKSEVAQLREEVAQLREKLDELLR